MIDCGPWPCTALRRVHSNVTELTWFSLWRTDQWASSNALQ